MNSDLILKRFFSKNMFHELLSESNDAFFDYVVKRYVKDPTGKDYKTLISEIYSYMGKNYRTEYYYKNTLLNKLLLRPNHDIYKTIALSELPIGQSKADFVLINGHGVVYEIKTELDNLDRLTSQINDYYKAFTRVVVVSYKENIPKLEKILNPSVGIMQLTPRNALKEIRKPCDVYSYLEHEAIFKILRKNEFESILKDNNIGLPEVSQFYYYKECLKLLKTIDIEVLQGLMLLQLKERMKIEVIKICCEVPQEIKSIIYFDSFKYNYNIINSVLQRKYGG